MGILKGVQAVALSIIDKDPYLENKELDVLCCIFTTSDCSHYSMFVKNVYKTDRNAGVKMFNIFVKN